jgi:hypothetical protein
MSALFVTDVNVIALRPAAQSAVGLSWLGSS